MSSHLTSRCPTEQYIPNLHTRPHWTRLNGHLQISGHVCLHQAFHGPFLPVSRLNEQACPDREHCFGCPAQYLSCLPPVYRLRSARIRSDPIRSGLDDETRRDEITGAAITFLAKHFMAVIDSLLQNGLTLRVNLGTRVRDLFPGGVGSFPLG